MKPRTLSDWAPPSLRAFLTGGVSGAFVFGLGLGCAYGDPYDPEQCSNGEDDDRDGLIDCQDAECANSELCSGSCGNGLDDDSNGSFDCDDPVCIPSEACRGSCTNRVDDDRDGDTDCADPDCARIDPCG